MCSDANSANVPPRQAEYTLPIWFWLGIALIAIWWPLNWLQVRPFSDSYFFPLWLGYILTVDGLVRYRAGCSLFTRSGWRVGLLFALSVPLWWLFEALNEVLQNWNYHLPADYSRVSYAIRASIAFSTVIPAVFVTTELVRSFRLNPLRRLPRLALANRTLLLLHLAGWIMLAAVLGLPEYAFPLVWMSLFFLIEPLATFVGARSIGSFLRNGDWSPVFNIGAGTLVCGLFWEMWNYYALPKWTYSIPYFDVAHIFEMPLLGYGGYIPFGLEIFSIVALLTSLFPRFKVPMARMSSLTSIDRIMRRNL